MSGTAGGLGQLRRRLAEPPPAPASQLPAAEPCEMCGTDLVGEHGHVADTHDHRLLCVCRPCHLLFDREGAGGGRFRGVGTEVRVLERLVLDDSQWDRLQIPVDLAFFFRQTGPEDTEGYVAFYPGPGGATESTLDLSSWQRVLDDNPVLAEVAPDIEAVLLRKQGGAYSCFVTPIDLCYELVGVVRAHWVGLAGGREVWDRIEAFFADLDSRGQHVPRGG